jgi:PurA ssDNA and RNA-binding protein
MISNESHSTVLNKQQSHGPKKSFSSEETLKTSSLQVERKSFVFTLKENPRGRFLRITEDVGGRRDSIIIPAPGLAEFKQILEAMVAATEETPLPDSVLD